MASTPVAPPAPAAHRPRLRWMVLAGVLLGLVLLWSVNGFEGGASTVQDEVGQQVDLGPAVLTVHDATAERSYDGGWTVKVNTTCQVTDDNAPDLALLADEMFALASVTSPVVYSETSLANFDPSTGFGLERDYLAPGLAPMPCVFQATMPKAWDPGTGVRVAFAELDFGDDSVTGNQDERWHAGSTTHRLQLPVRVVKEP